MDWLGSGIYFWEADPDRALEWAKSQTGKRKIANPAVIGAVIDLRNCLNLTNIRDLELVRDAFTRYKLEQDLSGLPMPDNKNSKNDIHADLLLRYLDCAVINHLHHMTDIIGGEKFDTVRGMFTEGGPLFEGAGLQMKTHSQIAVRDTGCIKGYFTPR